MLSCVVALATEHVTSLFFPFSHFQRTKKKTKKKKKKKKTHPRRVRAEGTQQRNANEQTAKRSPFFSASIKILTSAQEKRLKREKREGGTGRILSIPLDAGMGFFSLSPWPSWFSYPIAWDNHGENGVVFLSGRAGGEGKGLAS